MASTFGPNYDRSQLVAFPQVNRPEIDQPFATSSGVAFIEAIKKNKK